MGVVIDGRIRKCYLCFTYALVSAMSFCFSKSEFQELSEVSKFRVNSLSIVYCANHNLPTLKAYRQILVSR